MLMQTPEGHQLGTWRHISANPINRVNGVIFRRAPMFCHVHPGGIV